ncbi:SDR family NAD(P)-dependent oxidoreductase [Sporosarcina ureilytica]|uniref:SDR family NAD(P)-dependent oxidoreductase n=1 Tax=Sporosarcina ureilytica TaxID=298596 RepID=UPI000AB593FA|nr:SDR family NAD(P)-dependent oxidoreductase [Sporosarcina ureilytica]
MRKIEIVIVTGASKGIGLSVLKQLQEKGKKVIGLARTMPAKARHFVTVDLAETEKLEGVLTAIIREHIVEATSFTLINNAGTVEPIGLIGTVNSAEVSNAISINLTAPMILCNTFIRELEAFSGAKKIMNISSGAGRKPYEGWGAYCTTKAGLDHFSRVIAVEQERATNPVEIVSIAPGIIDTGMQETIRHSSEASFPLLNRFVEYKEQGLLSSAEETARNLISFLEKADFKTTGPIADIRHY